MILSVSYYTHHSVCVKTQKSTVFSYFAVEADIHSGLHRVCTSGVCNRSL